MMAHAPRVARATVYLLGAGPGDPELITVRAKRRLAEADLVLYDALVHPDILAHCRDDAEKVFVGKRAGRPSERQESINARMVEAARAGRTVARLKGGDPYLFGRGSEEAEALAAAGIAFEVVPGVPSPVAATAYAGLSLTHRTLSSSVAYLTATESEEKDRSSHDWSKLATATETLVIFMGMRKLASLMALLAEHGRPLHTPVAVVQWASLPRQRTIVGTVATIAEAAEGLGLPSLIIVGDVVSLREQLRWFDTGPLFGRRVLVTRAVHQAGSLAELLRDAGAEPICVPAIRTVPPEDDSPLRAACRVLDQYDWVVFTSANAVDAIMAALRRDGGDARRLGSAAVCAIGRKTAAALRVHGIEADLVPGDSRGEGVLAALTAVLPRRGERARILIPRAEVGRDVLPDGLRREGHSVDVVGVYRTLGPDDAGVVALREAIAEVDAVAFTSSSTVDQLVDAVGVDALRGRCLASIGPVTSATVRQHGLDVGVEATEASVESLVTALEECAFR